MQDLTFRNFLYVVAYIQSQRAQRGLERHFYQLKYSSNLEASCSFLVHLPNLQVFAVNNVFKGKFLGTATAQHTIIFVIFWGTATAQYTIN